MLVDVVVYDGLDELDAIGPLEVLRRAQRGGGDLEVRLVSSSAQPVVRGAFGLAFEVDGPFRPGEADILIVPGGGWAARSPTGAWAECQAGTLPRQLVEAAKGTRLLCGVCTGTMLLASSGVITGRRANTHRSAAEELATLGVVVVDDRVVDDGDLITSAGVTSGIDLALWLVERAFGVELAASIARSMEYWPVRPA